MRGRRYLFIIFLVLFIYAIWNGRNLILGPKIDIIEPNNGATVEVNPVPLKGIIQNASFISLNGRQIFTDNLGVFSEEVGLYPGYNVITLEVTDRFGKRALKKVELFYRGTLPEAVGPVASSTEESVEENVDQLIEN